MPTFLHVGCGRKDKTKTTKAFNRPEWQETRLDIDPQSKPDVVASMLDMSSVANQSVDAIFTSHNLEHLYAHEVPVALLEFKRVLSPQGFLVATCPDLQEICRLVGEGRLVDPLYSSPAGPISALDILYGHRKSLADGNHFMAHKCGFTLKVLVDLLSAAGFAKVAGYRRKAPYFDLWVVASKAPQTEDEIKALLEAHQPR
jgi:hypothetical protein